jgi:hypothetical protein
VASGNAQPGTISASAGVIAGASIGSVLGAVVVVGMVMLAFIFVARRRGNKNQVSSFDRTARVSQEYIGIDAADDFVMTARPSMLARPSIASFRI